MPRGVIRIPRWPARHRRIPLRPGLLTRAVFIYTIIFISKGTPQFQDSGSRNEIGRSTGRAAGAADPDRHAVLPVGSGEQLERRPDSSFPQGVLPQRLSVEPGAIGVLPGI